MGKRLFSWDDFEKEARPLYEAGERWGIKFFPDVELYLVVQPSERVIKRAGHPDETYTDKVHVDCLICTANSASDPNFHPVSGGWFFSLGFPNRNFLYWILVEGDEDGGSGKLKELGLIPEGATLSLDKLGDGLDQMCEEQGMQKPFRFGGW